MLRQVSFAAFSITVRGENNQELTANLLFTFAFLSNSLHSRLSDSLKLATGGTPSSEIALPGPGFSLCPQKLSPKAFASNIPNMILPVWLHLQLQTPEQKSATRKSRLISIATTFYRRGYPAALIITAWSCLSVFFLAVSSPAPQNLY